MQVFHVRWPRVQIEAVSFLLAGLGFQWNFLSRTPLPLPSLLIPKVHLKSKKFVSLERVLEYDYANHDSFCSY